jgi:hypothetical protein
MKIKFLCFSLLILLLINSYSILHSSELRRSKDWIPEIVDSIVRVTYPKSFFDSTLTWRIDTRNTLKIDKKNGKLATINITKKDQVSKGYLGFYRLKDCSSIDASFFVKYQASGNVADRIFIYWGEFKNYQTLPVLYNFTILKDGHYRVNKLVDKSKPIWVCIHDGFVNNWNPATICNVIRIQQNGDECKISVNGEIQICTMLGSFDGVETGFDISGSESWDINKIEFAE